MTTPTLAPATIPTLQLNAANDNPGGNTHADVPLSAFVTLMAKAYVAKTRAVKRSA